MNQEEEEDEHTDMLRYRRGLEKNKRIGVGGRTMLDVSDITSLSGSTGSGSQEEQETPLGTIFADRGEGRYLVTYIKRPAKEYFKCILSECTDTMQIHLLMAMNSGRATEALNLSRDDNRTELVKITEDEFVKAKRKGVKPVREWSDRRIETLRSKLDIINLVGTTTTVL